MKLLTYIIACLSLIIFSCKGQTNGKFESIDATVFARMIESTPNAQILDVRTPEEYASGHIDKAININWNGADFEAKVIKAFDKTKPVFVYCRSGNRSKKASAKLSEMGFKKIYELDGGYLSWT